MVSVTLMYSNSIVSHNNYCRETKEPETPEKQENSKTNEDKDETESQLDNPSKDESSSDPNGKWASYFT